MGDCFTEKYGFLDKNPVKLTVEKGRVVKIDCENKVLEEGLWKHFKSDEHADRVSEFALGTNPFIKDFVGVFVQDEKVPGVHIAIGNPYPEMTGAGYSSKIHVDCITRDPTVWVDGKKGNTSRPRHNKISLLANIILHETAFGHNAAGPLQTTNL